MLSCKITKLVAERVKDVVTYVLQKGKKDMAGLLVALSMGKGDGGEQTEAQRSFSKWHHEQRFTLPK